MDKRKEKVVFRGVGPKGKKEGIFKRKIEKGPRLDEIESTEAKEKHVKGVFNSILALPIAETLIADYEAQSISIIERHGIEIKKPYKLNDKYLVDGKNISFFKPPQKFDNKEFEGKSVGDIYGAVARYINKPEWMLEPLGRAAAILKFCEDLRQSIKAGSIDRIVNYSMVLQREVDEFNFSSFEYAIRIGLNEQERMSEAAVKSAKARTEENLDRNKRIIRKNDKGVSSANISESEGLSIRQVQKIIKKEKSKK